MLRGQTRSIDVQIIPLKLFYTLNLSWGWRLDSLPAKNNPPKCISESTFAQSQFQRRRRHIPAQLESLPREQRAFHHFSFPPHFPTSNIVPSLRERRREGKTRKRGRRETLPMTRLTSRTGVSVARIPAGSRCCGGARVKRATTGERKGKRGKKKGRGGNSRLRSGGNEGNGEIPLPHFIIPHRLRVLPNSFDFQGGRGGGWVGGDSKRACRPLRMVTT